MLARNPDAGVLQPLQHADVFFKLRLGAHAVGFVGTRKMRKRTGDAQVFQSIYPLNQLNRTLVGGKADAAHAGVDFEVNRTDNAAPTREHVELLRRVIGKNGRREIILDNIFELTVAGIAEQQHRLGASGFAQRRALLPDGNRIALNAALFESGIDSLFAVAVTVALEHRHNLHTVADDLADTADIVLQRAQADDRFGPLRQSSHKLSPVFVFFLKILPYFARFDNIKIAR